MRNNDIKEFIDGMTAALGDNKFVKATIGNYKGPVDQLQKVKVRRIRTKRGDRLQFVSCFSNREEAGNFDVSEATAETARLLSEGFRSARLFTTDGDLQLELGPGGRSKLSKAPATFHRAPETSHDRGKKTFVDPTSEYLKLLGVSSAEGKVKDKQQSKFRQINRFVEIVGGLVSDAGFLAGETVTIADMGSGKGYLTFAVYDHLVNNAGLKVRMTGVEVRSHLVEICSKVAAECGFEGLSFVQGTIDSADVGEPEVLIALHACDTATDDAIYKGIVSGSKVILAAPCCQKELRKQLRFPEPLEALNRFGILLESETESVTDGLRAVLLGHCGYKVRISEFISPEHTPKNNLISAVLKASPGHRSDPCPEAAAIMETFGIRSQRLHSLLKDQKSDS